MTDWYRWSLVDLVSRLRARQVGPVELVESLLERIALIDGDVRAFVTVTAELARHQAREAQRVLSRDCASAPVLTGVPVALKDLFDVRCVVTTAGSRLLVDNVASKDSASWRRLRRHGAVLVGKANTHEFAYGGACEPTRNPWDLERMAGGSSGGSAAALASGMCFGALGTDTAGSIRIPAALCGTVGLKPSRGATSPNGVFPLSPTLDHVGPMARTPRDALLLLRALRSRSVLTTLSPAGEVLSQNIDGLRVGLLPPQERVAGPVLQALHAAAAALSDAGARVEEAPVMVDMASAARVNFTIMAAEAAHIHRNWLESMPSEYTPYVRARLSEAFATTAVDYLDAMKARERFVAQWEEAMAGFDALLVNGVPCTAPIAYEEEVRIDGIDEDRDRLFCRDMAFANITGQPAVVIPAGVDGHLPVSVQLVGRRGADELLLCLGQAVFDRLASPLP